VKSNAHFIGVAPEDGAGVPQAKRAAVAADGRLSRHPTPETRHLKPGPWYVWLGYVLDKTG